MTKSTIGPALAQASAAKFDARIALSAKAMRESEPDVQPESLDFDNPWVGFAFYAAALLLGVAWSWVAR